MHRLPLMIAYAVAVFSLAACGSKETTSTGAPQSSRAPSGEATAQQVAKETRGNVKCPARASAERPAGAPVDDVAGVRPGMPWDEAANFVLCDNPLLVVKENSSRPFNINTSGQHIRQGFDAKFAAPRVDVTPEQYEQQTAERAARRSGNAVAPPIQSGQIRFFVSSMGLPGKEQVISVSREEYFAEDKLPTVDSVKQALIAKYGQPSPMTGNPQVSYLWWEYDPAGGRINEGAPSSGSCRLEASPDAGTSLSSDCGIAVAALIQISPDNPSLARSLAVTSQNGAKGFALLNDTEAAIRKGGAQ